MKAMISQPMRGKTKEEIRQTREKATRVLEKMGYEVADTLFDIEAEIPEEITSRPLYFLSKSIAAMSGCQVVYFCADWQEARGCCAEHLCAEAYGLKRIYETGVVG